MRTALLLAAFLGISGCASSEPQPQSYLLYPAQPREGVTSSADHQLAIGRIAVAPYLQSEGIVVETADHQVREARDHRWAEPLPSGLRRLLRHDLAAATGRSVAADPRGAGRPVLVVDVDVQRLHGSEDGVVTLVADWTWRRSRDIVGHHSLVRQVRTRAGGYAALVDAHIELIGGLAAAMAESVPD